jgi:hypothetical protein
VLLVSLAVLSLVGSGQATERLAEQSIKAAFLFNFAIFVTWPQPGTANQPFVVCVIGDTGIVTELSRASRSKTVRGREFVVREQNQGDDPDACQILFITESADRYAPAVLRRIHGPVLTIGETPFFLREGGMMRFVIVDERVKFQIDAGAAERAGLRIGSQLLSVAAK